MKIPDGVGFEDAASLPVAGGTALRALRLGEVSPGDKVLIGRNGMFSNKWIDMCQRFGLEVEVLDHVWGEGLSAARYAEALWLEHDEGPAAYLAHLARAIERDIRRNGLRLAPVENLGV